MVMHEEELDEIEHIVQSDSERETPRQQLPGAPVDCVEPEPQAEQVCAVDYLEIFVQTHCGLEFDIQWGAERAAGTYTISGPRQVELLVDKLRMSPAQLQGRLSPKSTIPVPEDEREGAGIPTHAEEFCYIHPLQSFSNLLWPRAADELRRIRHDSNTDDAMWIDAVLEGGFAYFVANDEKPVRVNAISLQQTSTEMVFRGERAEAQNVVDEMDRAGRLADIVENSEFAAGFTRVGWVHPNERFGEPERHQLVSDKEDYPDGGFMVLHVPKTEGGPEETWFYIMIDPTDEHYVEYKRVAQQHMADGLDDGTLSAAYNEAVRRETHHTGDKDVVDYLAISIAQEVKLKIETSWADSNEDKHAGEYRIVGPPEQHREVSKTLETMLELKPGQLRGSLSPKCNITIPKESRRNAGIPYKAVRNDKFH